MARKHWIGGAGLHGYLYQDGPHYFDTKEEAVQYFAQAYDKRGIAAGLRRDHHVELNLERDGNEYIEITEEKCTGGSCERCANAEYVKEYGSA